MGIQQELNIDSLFKYFITIDHSSIGTKNQIIFSKFKIKFKKELYKS